MIQSQRKPHHLPAGSPAVLFCVLRVGEISVLRGIGAADLQFFRGVYDAAVVAKAHLAESMKYSVIFIASAPLLIAYPFVQKYFVKGMMVGSLKG